VKMAAAAAKAAAAAAQAAEEMAVEYESWHHCVDLTETTGVMRLLVVSMALTKDKNSVHNVPEHAEFDEDELAPTAKHYDKYHHQLEGEPEDDDPPGKEDAIMSDEDKLKNQRDLLWRSPIGFKHQETYDIEWIRIRDEFYSNTVFGNVDIDKRDDKATPNVYTLKNGQGVVVVENATGGIGGRPMEDGLWYGGPVKATRYALLPEDELKRKTEEYKKAVAANEAIATLKDYDEAKIQYIWDYAAEKNVFYLPEDEKAAFEDAKKELVEKLDVDAQNISDLFIVYQTELLKITPSFGIGAAIEGVASLITGNTQKRRIEQPWKLASEGEKKFGVIERWMYEGTGETTALGVTKSRKWKPFSQCDLEGDLALTDREKRYLREAFQLSKKKLRGEALSQKEIMNEEEIFQVVEFGPCHNVSAGVHQVRIKSLVKQMKHKCVFWTNTENDLPGGSIEANTIDHRIEETDTQAYDLSQARKPNKAANSKGQFGEDGAGNEVFEFWKYGKLLGTIRKRYVKQDRQRLIDTIEQFTPTYKGMVKRKGESGHEISEVNMQMCINCAAFALDTTMPEMQEDQVACYIKMHLEMVLGPTWHVIVGRNFGYCITTEARHFIVIRIRHLEVMIWKSEPDPNTGKKQDVEG